MTEPQTRFGRLVENAQQELGVGPVYGDGSRRPTEKQLAYWESLRISPRKRRMIRELKAQGVTRYKAAQALSMPPSTLGRYW